MCIHFACSHQSETVLRGENKIQRESFGQSRTNSDSEVTGNLTWLSETRCTNTVKEKHDFVTYLEEKGEGRAEFRGLQSKKTSFYDTQCHCPLISKISTKNFITLPTLRTCMESQSGDQKSIYSPIFQRALCWMELTEDFALKWRQGHGRNYSQGQQSRWNIERAEKEVQCDQDKEEETLSLSRGGKQPSQRQFTLVLMSSPGRRDARHWRLKEAPQSRRGRSSPQSV